MVTGKIRVENYRGLSCGIFDEKNRLHATAVTDRADLQAICDGYNSFVDLQGGPIVVGYNFKENESAGADPATPSEEPRRGPGRPRGSRKDKAATE